jgi:hypothetical protein
MPAKTIVAITTEKIFREIFREIFRIATMQILTGNAKLLPPPFWIPAIDHT